MSTPINDNLIKIQIGRNPYHIIPKIQFPVQLSTRCIVCYIRSLVGWFN
jgi:hypothetical protein